MELFLYVGGLVAPAAHSTLDVAHSAAVVSGVFYALKNVVFNSADLTLNTQHHIYMYIYMYMYMYMYMYCVTVITLLVYASRNCTQDLQRLGTFYDQ